MHWWIKNFVLNFLINSGHLKVEADEHNWCANFRLIDMLFLEIRSPEVIPPFFPLLNLISLQKKKFISSLIRKIKLK